MGGWVGGASLSPNVNVSEPDGAPVAGTDAPHARLGQHSSLRLHLHARNRKRLQGDRAVAPSRRVVPCSGVPHVLHCIGRSEEAGGPHRNDILLRGDGRVVLRWLDEGALVMGASVSVGDDQQRPTYPVNPLPRQNVDRLVRHLQGGRGRSRRRGVRKARARVRPAVSGRPGAYDS